MLPRDNVSNFLLAGNSFKQFFGQAFFQTTGANAGNGDRVIFNTFASCPLYDPAFVGHRNGYVAYNWMIGCTAGVENDHATDNTGGNIFDVQSGYVEWRDRWHHGWRVACRASIRTTAAISCDTTSFRDRTR